MSVFLLALSTLEKNEGKVPLCDLPIRTLECGNNFSCHFKPDEKSVLDNFERSHQIVFTEENKKSFALPKNWFCNQFVLMAFRTMEEQNKKQVDSIQGFFEKTPMRPIDKGYEDLNLSIEEIESSLNSKSSISEMFDYLEDKGMRCYYGLTATIKGENKGIQLLACYQEAEEHCLIPNESFKVVIHVNFYVNGTVEFVDFIISKREDIAFQKIVDFEKSIS